MQDAWRAYLELALGLTEAPRKRAQDAARRLVGTGGATAGQLQALAEELLATGAANREALTKLVRFEVDRALGAVGLATADEVAELTRRVHELERQLREAKGGPGVLPVADAAPDTTVPPTRRPPHRLRRPTHRLRSPARRPGPWPRRRWRRRPSKKAASAEPSTGVDGPAEGAAPSRPVKKAGPGRRHTGDAE